MTFSFIDRKNQNKLKWAFNKACNAYIVITTITVMLISDSDVYAVKKNVNPNLQ